MEEVQPNVLSPDPFRSNYVYYEGIPEELNQLRKLKSHGKVLNDYLYHNSRISLKAHKDLEIYQNQDESHQEFMSRLKQAARERRDIEIDKLEKKYEKQLDRLEDKIEKLSRDLSSDEAEYEARKREEIIGIGETVLGYFMGRKRTTVGTTASRRRRMTSRVKREIEDTKEEIEDLQKDYEE